MKTIIFVLLTAFTISAQEVNIVQHLKDIESGNKQNAVSALNDLKKSNPNDPSVIFLDGVLDESGESALSKYENVYRNYPKSNYADAALYRIFSYYYSLGIYNRAKDYLTALESGYPNSPYLKIADRNIPEEDLITETAEITPAPKVTQKPVKIISENTAAKFTVQAGAFLNLDNAKSLKDNLEDDGFPSELSTKEVGGTILNVVTAGKFDTELNAQNLISLLKSKYNLNGRVISIE